MDLTRLKDYSLQKNSDLTALGNAIREKTGGTDLLTVPQMTEAVNLIEVGGGGDIEYLDYAEVEGGYEVTGLKDGCEVTDIIIPSTYNGKSVIRIGDYAFENRTNLTSVTIPDSITSIGVDAFNNCTNLTSVTIGNSVTSIGRSAFEYCDSLTSVTIPDNVTSIGDSAFYFCERLTNIFIGNGVTSIGIRAFENCDSLKTVTFKGTPTTIDTTVFSSCTNLTDINVPWAEGEVAGSPWGATNADIDYEYKNTPIIQPLTITENGTYTASGGVDGYSPITVNVASSGGADDSNLIAFIEGSTDEFVIPDGTTQIRDGCFAGMYDLTSVIIPNSVTTIHSRAFESCECLISVTIPSSVTTIYGGPFPRCTSLENINVASDNPNYQSIDGVLYTKDGKKLVQYPPGNKRESYTILDGVTEINSEAFHGTYYWEVSLTSVTIPDSVTEIGTRAFKEIVDLKSITIPAGVTQFGSEVFKECQYLEQVVFKGTPWSVSEDTFLYCSNLTDIYVPWAEGAKEGAPWGAYNATIHYNSEV